jgi:hypothetical protein
LALPDLGRSEERVGVYDEVVARFGDAPEPALRDLVTMETGTKCGRHEFGDQS